jgi:hypothetical protein
MNPPSPSTQTAGIESSPSGSGSLNTPATGYSPSGNAARDAARLANRPEPQGPLLVGENPVEAMQSLAQSAIDQTQAVFQKLTNFFDSFQSDSSKATLENLQNNTENLKSYIAAWRTYGDTSQTNAEIIADPKTGPELQIILGRALQQLGEDAKNPPAGVAISAEMKKEIDEVLKAAGGNGSGINAENVDRVLGLLRGSYNYNQDTNSYTLCDWADQSQGHYRQGKINIRTTSLAFALASGTHTLNEQDANELESRTAINVNGTDYSIITISDALKANERAAFASDDNTSILKSSADPSSIDVEGLSDKESAAIINNIDKLSPAARSKLISVSKNLGINPVYLAAAISFETGGTFSPSITNGAGSGATGLIQFMPETAQGLGTSVEALAGMSQEEQLNWVEKYFGPHRGKLHNLEDVYMAILYPVAVGEDNNYALFTGGIEYDQNSGLDTNKDGVVTKQEAAGKVREHLNRILNLAPESIAQQTRGNSQAQSTHASSQANQNLLTASEKYLLPGNKISYSEMNCVEFMTHILTKDLGLQLSPEDIKIGQIGGLNPSNYQAAVVGGNPVVQGYVHALTRNGANSPAVKIQGPEIGAIVQFDWIENGQRRGHAGIVQSLITENGKVVGFNVISSTNFKGLDGTSVMPVMFGKELDEHYYYARLK